MAGSKETHLQTVPPFHPFNGITLRGTRRPGAEAGSWAAIRVLSRDVQAGGRWGGGGGGGGVC